MKNMVFSIMALGVENGGDTRTEDEVVQHFRDDEHRTSEADLTDQLHKAIFHMVFGLALHFTSDKNRVLKQCKNMVC